MTPVENEIKNETKATVNGKPRWKERILIDNYLSNKEGWLGKYNLLKVDLSEVEQELMKDFPAEDAKRYFDYIAKRVEKGKL